MKMNYLLAKEIYGLNPWFVDAHSFPVLSSILESAKNGSRFEDDSEKCNSIFLFNPNSAKIVDRPYGPYWNPGQLDSKENFEAIGVINVDGPITVNGGYSSNGVKQISAQMLSMSKDDRIKGFVIVGNSGGGSSAAVEIFTRTILEIRKTKPVNSVIPEGGMAASAMYGILTATGNIYAESEMSIVGSSGTMVQFDGRKANTESPDGVKHIRLYASKSTHKNKDFEEALNHDNYDLIINELLDPINERFQEHNLTNRPLLQGTSFDNGHTKFAKDSVGTFIDGLASFDQVVELTMKEAKSKNKGTKNNINKNSSKMTIDQLRSEHPETYNSIFKAGVDSEKDRVGTWMAHIGTDAEVVKNGIKSGEIISGAVREELLVKATSKAHLKSLQKDSPENVRTKESESGEEKSEDEKEFESMYGNLAKTI